METQTTNNEHPPTLTELDSKRAVPTTHAGINGTNTPDIFTKFLVLEGWSHWFFRLGFASIFLVNALYAIFEPVSFASVIEQNVIAGRIGQTDLMVKFAIINDLLLSVFIVGGWRKQLVYAWAGAWLLMPAGLKLMNLIL